MCKHQRLETSHALLLPVLGHFCQLLKLVLHILSNLGPLQPICPFLCPWVEWVYTYPNPIRLKHLHYNERKCEYESPHDDPGTTRQSTDPVLVVHGPALPTAAAQAEEDTGDRYENAQQEEYQRHGHDTSLGLNDLKELILLSFFYRVFSSNH